MSTLTIAFTETSCQTAPLPDYDPFLLDRAATLFRMVARRIGPVRARQHRGSFSFIAASSDLTAAKIVIYELGKGKMNGPDPHLVNGVYVFIRLSGNAIGHTLGVAPKHHERFAYFRLQDGQIWTRWPISLQLALGRSEHPPSR